MRLKKRMRLLNAALIQIQAELMRMNADRSPGPEMPRNGKPLMTLAGLAQQALAVQDAVNGIAIASSYAEALIDLRSALDAAGLPCGTDDINQHPINRLWVEKLVDLSGFRYDHSDLYYSEVKAICTPECVAD